MPIGAGNSRWLALPGHRRRPLHRCLTYRSSMTLVSCVGRRPKRNRHRVPSRGAAREIVCCRDSDTWRPQAFDSIMDRSPVENTGTRPSAELLYLLHGDPAELQEAISGLRAADVAEALRDLAPEAGAKVMAALPFDLAVQIFDEPELSPRRC